MNGAPVRLEKQRGFAAYVFLVIAMLSLTAVVAAKMSRAGGQQQWNFETKNTVLDQSKIIRTRIIGCAIAFPAGNNGTGFHPRFPATPGTGLVSDLVCPGQAAPNNLWTGVGGMTLAAAPGGFSAWTYNNDGSSIRISIQAVVGTTDRAAMNVLDAIAVRIGSNASRVGATLTITLMV